MENASKALIIAGAILISIVLITLGVVILGQGQEVVNSSNIDDAAIQSFNQKFTQYEGTNVTGSRVNALINAVTANNTVALRDGEENKLITIVDSTGGDLGTITATTAVGTITGTAKTSKKAQTGKTYTVTTDKNANGYINKITISK